MRLSPSRHISILGTEVRAEVKNAADGKTALKEIKQKKNEFALKRRALVYQQKKAKAAAEKAEGPVSERRRTGVFAAFRRLVGKVQSRAPRRSLADLETQIQDIDEILFNLDSCKVQIEGKLLHLG